MTSPVTPDLDKPSNYALMILNGLQFTTSVYGGTVDPEVVQARRTRNRAARKARKVTRRASR